ncbi:TPA: hypothetical protein ACH3X2_001084 [Trebouxia sp. C0005]
MSSVGSRTLSSVQKKEVLDRLILERQSKPSLSSAPSTESVADKRERVQQLLRERRASQGVRTVGGNSSLVSPESSVGGLSEHRYQWHSHPVAEPGLVVVQSTSVYESAPRERLSDHEEHRIRPQLPDLESSQPGPIEIDTSLLYTPQSGNSSTDVSHSGAHEQPSMSHQSHHSAWHLSQQHEAEGEAQSGYHGDEPFAGEEGVSSSSRASLSDLGYASGPRPANGARQRAVSVPRDRPNFKSTVPREFNLSGAHPKMSKQAVLERRQQQQQHDDDLTFRPNVTGSQGRSQSAGKQRPTGDQRLEQLARPKTAHWDKCAQLKLEEDGQQLTGCTFAPKTGRPPKEDAAPKQPFPDRLYRRRDGKYAQWEKLRLEAEAAALRECTFAPKAVANNRRHLAGYVPIQDRLGDLQRRRSERLAQTQLSVEEDPNLTFAPAVNDRSMRLAISKELREVREDLPLADRLTSRQPLKLNPGVIEEEAQCTFTPHINPASEQLLEDSLQVPANFYERQRFFYEMRQERMQRLQAEAEDKQCTFSPETGTAAHVLAASEQPHARESFLDKVERLATLDKQKQDACREATAEHYYAQFSFQPKINARSKRIANASPLSELHKNNRARVLHEEQAREAEQRFRRDHTFKPALYHSHKAPHSGARLALPHSTDGYKENGGQEVIPAANFTLHKQDPEHLVRRIDAYKRDRQARIAEAKAAHEYSELLDCTFTPAITRRVPQPTGPVVVRGLERYMELQESAKAKEAAKRSREAEVFILNPQGAPTTHTVPKPFKLHESTHQAKLQAQRAQLKQSLVAEAMKECTFKPKTIEGQNRELIAKILQAEEESNSHVTAAH